MTKIINKRKEQFELLLKVHKEQCPQRKIKYKEYEAVRNQSWIVMEGIELSYMMYQGEYQPIFMCGRYSEKYGDGIYYFKTFSECEKVWGMQEKELNKHIELITL